MSLAGWIATGLLGGLAAGGRYLLDYEISARTGERFPFGILAVNVLGSLALGLLAGSTLRGEALTIAAGGVLGSFTTFSTWMLDTRKLSARGDGALAWLNIAVPLLAGFGALALGHWLAS